MIGCDSGLSLSLTARLGILGVIAALATASPGALEAQLRSQPDTTLSGLYQLDFGVPEAPAFNILEVDESNILRPGTVRELSLAVSEFTGSDLLLPKTFSAEFAPALLLAGRDLTRRAYGDQAWLYRLRVSAAVQRVDESSSATRIAFGIRTTLTDGADLRTNEDAKAYAVFRSGVAASLAGSKDALQRAIQDLFGLSPTEELTTAIDTLFGGDADRAVVKFVAAGLSDDDALRAIDLFSAGSGDAAASEAKIRQWRKELQDKHWNALVVEIAYAARAEAADSTGRDLSVDRHGFWLTAGFPIGTWGQLLVGGEVGVTRDTITTDFDGRGSLGTRLYWGGNGLKFFMEVEGDFAEGRSTEFLFNSGGELRPEIGGWMSFSAGLNRDAETKNYDLVTEFRWSFPFDPLGGS